MPILKASTYKSIPYYVNGHVETILPSLFRKIKGVSYCRERLELADGDFLDLDWLWADSNKLVIISHGLEGSSSRHYVMGMAKFFHMRGWNVLAWNCRSCSGEMNRLPRLYHHGASEDLEAVIGHVVVQKKYQSISLIGFSMGGSLAFKYLGEKSSDLPKEIKSCVGFSVPCDVGSSARELEKPHLAFYRKRFLRKLINKMALKSIQFPSTISPPKSQKLRDFKTFDNQYTAPLHGFSNADDFYAKASATNYISSIQIPTLLVNADNDPMLPKACYPINLARESSNFYLEIPKRGGHVGFPIHATSQNWMEHRAFEFISKPI